MHPVLVQHQTILYSVRNLTFQTKILIILLNHVFCDISDGVSRADTFYHLFSQTALRYRCCTQFLTGFVSGSFFVTVDRDCSVKHGAYLTNRVTKRHCRLCQLASVLSDKPNTQRAVQLWPAQCVQCALVLLCLRVPSQLIFLHHYSYCYKKDVP